MSVLATIRIVNSKRDIAGNRYFFFEFTVAATRQTIMGKVSGGESNIRGAVYQILPPENCYTTTEELKIRAWNKEAKTMEYAGSSYKDIADFIKSKLTPESTRSLGL